MSIAVCSSINDRKSFPFSPTTSDHLFPSQKDLNQCFYIKCTLSSAQLLIHLVFSLIFNIEKNCWERCKVIEIFFLCDHCLWQVRTRLFMLTISGATYFRFPNREKYNGHTHSIGAWVYYSYSYYYYHYCSLLGKEKNMFFETSLFAVNTLFACKVGFTARHFLSHSYGHSRIKSREWGRGKEKNVINMKIIIRFSKQCCLAYQCEVWFANVYSPSTQTLDILILWTDCLECRLTHYCFVNFGLVSILFQGEFVVTSFDLPWNATRVVHK